MFKVNIEPNLKYQEKLDKAKETIKKNWKPFTIGVTLTAVTFIVTRRITMRYLPVEGTTVIIHKAIVKDGSSLYKVFNIYSDGFKQHGPSWMVRCLETGTLFRSQEHAARVMDLSKDHMSNHLNGTRHNVGGYHFERIGVAV
jgi:hypothetical protein